VPIAMRLDFPPGPVGMVAAMPPDSEDGRAFGVRSKLQLIIVLGMPDDFAGQCRAGAVAWPAKRFDGGTWIGLKASNRQALSDASPHPPSRPAAQRRCGAVPVLSLGTG
jgi:hypothetical protein